MLRKVRRYCHNLTNPVTGEVWQLHHVRSGVNPDESLRPYEISPDKLETMIGEYLRKGYEFISVSQIFEPRKKKFVAVTLDDGYEDNFTVAYPIFKKLNCPFCIFVASDYVFDNPTREKKGGLTQEQLKELFKDSLCTIGGHTKSHCHLSRLTKEEQFSEISGGKRELEEFIGKKIEFFAYPYGDYDSTTIECVKEAGITYAFAAWGGGIRKGDIDLFQIKRILI